MGLAGNCRCHVFRKKVILFGVPIIPLLPDPYRTNPLSEQSLTIIIENQPQTIIFSSFTITFNANISVAAATLFADSIS